MSKLNKGSSKGPDPVSTGAIYRSMQTVEAIRFADKLQSTIKNIFDKVFNNDETPYGYTFMETNDLVKPASTEVTDPYPFHVTTKLKTSILGAASQEYTTIVIFHEIVHGILDYQGMTPSLQHSAILESYVNEIVQAGKYFFPNLPTQDARALVLLGLADVSQTTAYQTAMSDFNLTMDLIAQIGLSYRRDNVAGNVLKGTPCAE